jgi:hypothetical protein
VESRSRLRASRSLSKAFVTTHTTRNPGLRFIRQSLNRTVTVGPELRHRLEQAAQPLGGDANWLARAVLRRYLETHEQAARAAERPARPAEHE